MTLSRHEERAFDALRPVHIETDYTKWAEGSVLCCYGDTKVLCNATVEQRVPGWLKDQGRGWVTAEYSMLPRATDSRSGRESMKGRVGGRTHEISRLIGRSLRAGIDLEKLGERSIVLDCDVIQADGGTRTASITGAWIALALAVRRIWEKEKLTEDPMLFPIAAVSVGLVDGLLALDLDYAEDQRADTDMNLVMTAEGGLVEIQGTAEGKPFSKLELDQMLSVGASGIRNLCQAQQLALEKTKP